MPDCFLTQSCLLHKFPTNWAGLFSAGFDLSRDYILKFTSRAASGRAHPGDHHEEDASRYRGQRGAGRCHFGADHADARCRGCGVGLGIVGGLAAGAIIGGAIAGARSGLRLSARLLSGRRLRAVCAMARRRPMAAPAATGRAVRSATSTATWSAGAARGSSARPTDRPILNLNLTRRTRKRRRVFICASACAASTSAVGQQSSLSPFAF